jgi:hypothetical protein
LQNQFGFNQNVGIVLQYKTLSCFIINFAILISMIHCEHFNLVDITLPDPFLRMRVGWRGHYIIHVCFMIFLRRIAYPSSYSDHINEYNIPSMRICEIYPAILAWVHNNNAHSLFQPISSCYCGYLQLLPGSALHFLTS